MDAGWLPEQMEPSHSKSTEIEANTGTRLGETVTAVVELCHTVAGRGPVHVCWGKESTRQGGTLSCHPRKMVCNSSH